MKHLIVPILLAASPAVAGELDPVADFGANPGALKMYEHVPDGLPVGRPLVVVLHGCTQTATSMLATGWNALADRLGFAVVYAEQQTANNPVGCFNWAGEYGDLANLRRGEGENASIMAMIDSAIARHGVDRARVYVTGFSAGGAFTAVMMATWPDRIAAGAIQSGVPFDCAESVNQAYSCQSLDQHPELQHTPEEWAARVRAAAGAHGATFPRVAIWHGTIDGIVDPVAADELVEQWVAVLGAGAAETETIGGQVREIHRVGAVAAVERWTIAGMGHAVSMGAADPDGECSAAAAYFEDHGVCSTARIAEFFGLAGEDPGADPDPDGGGGSDGGCDVAATGDGGGCSTGGGSSAVLVLGVLALARGLQRRRS